MRINIKRVLPAGLLMVIFIAALFGVGSVVGADDTGIALITMNNLSGVEFVGGNKLTTSIGNLVSDYFKKDKTLTYYNPEKTREMMTKADLSLYYESSNLCTNEDMAKIGQKIGVSNLAVLEINGYTEIKKENSSKSYQLLLGLKVFNCNDGTVAEYQAEGLGDGERSKALLNAVTQLFNNYLNPQADDPNDGTLRANNIAVIGNKASKLYHLTETNHQPKVENQETFNTRTNAEQSQYRPCPICFPSYKSFSNGDRNIEENLGSEACGTIEYYYRLADDGEQIERLRKIAVPLIKNTIRKNYDYKFRILDTDEVNSFAAPNGYIYMTRGMLDIVESDDEIAMVIAHEMGHLEKKHAVVKYKQAIAVSFLTAIFIAGTSKDSNAQTATVFGVVMATLILKGYSQEQEKEADEVAVTHLKNTGLDSQSYHSLFGKLIDMRKRKIYAIDKIFSTHPTPENRIANLDNFLKAYADLQLKLQ